MDFLEKINITETVSQTQERANNFINIDGEVTNFTKKEGLAKLITEGLAPQEIIDISTKKADDLKPEEIATAQKWQDSVVWTIQNAKKTTAMVDRIQPKKSYDVLFLEVDGQEVIGTAPKGMVEVGDDVVVHEIKKGQLNPNSKDGRDNIDQFQVCIKTHWSAQNSVTKGSAAYMRDKRKGLKKALQAQSETAPE